MNASGTIKGLLIIDSLDLTKLMDQYRLFFVGLLPSMFILAILIEFLAELSPFSLVKRAFISILILTTISTFYHQSISASIDSADSILEEAKQNNILLMDMFEGGKYLDQLNSSKTGKDFFKDESTITGLYSFLKYHLFNGFVNDGLTVAIFFITKVCFLILKVVYSIVYYLGYGLIGIPCLLYLFPGMGAALRGAILSFVWCLIVPHVLVFILTIIGSEINKGYVAGGIIGGSIMGTALLFVLTLFLAFIPLIAGMILNGSGMAQAGGIIAAIGANYVMNLPKSSVNTGASMLIGGPLGPKATLARNMAKGSYKFAKGLKDKMPGFNKFSAGKAHSGGPHFGSSNMGHPKGLGSTAISGNLPPYTNDSDYVTLKNSNSKKSGVDFISAPTQKNSLYNSSQMNNDSNNSGRVFPRSPSHSNQAKAQNNRGNYDRTVQRHGESNRQPQKANNLDRGSRHRFATRPPYRRRMDEQKTR